MPATGDWSLCKQRFAFSISAHLPYSLVGTNVKSALGMRWLLGPGKKAFSTKGKRGELVGKEPYFSLPQNIVCNESPAYSHVRELLRTNPERIAKPSIEEATSEKSRLSQLRGGMVTLKPYS